MPLPDGIAGLVHGVPAWFSRLLGASQSQVPTGTQVYSQNVDVVDRQTRLLGRVNVQNDITIEGGNITVDDGSITITGGNVVVDSGAITSTEAGLAATRAGNGTCHWINAITPGAAQTVLTNGPAGDQPGIYYNIQEGRQVALTMFCFGVNTLNDDCDFELGYTSGANGGGTFTPLTPQFNVTTGAAREGRATFDKLITPPLVAKYSDGVRSITSRVDANDAGCQITVAWHGWVENET